MNRCFRGQDNIIQLTRFKAAKETKLKIYISLDNEATIKCLALQANSIIQLLHLIYEYYE